MRRRAIRLDDPDDLGKYGSASIHLFYQFETLDFARRYYKRQDDKTSKRRSEEIKKILHQISNMQTIAVRSLVPEDVIRKRWELIK